MDQLIAILPTPCGLATQHPRPDIISNHLRWPALVMANTRCTMDAGTVPLGCCLEARPWHPALQMHSSARRNVACESTQHGKLLQAESARLTVHAGRTRSLLLPRLTETVRSARARVVVVVRAHTC